MKEKLNDKIIKIYLVIFVLVMFINCIVYMYNLIRWEFIAGIIVLFGGIGLVLYIYNVIKNKNVRYWDLLVILIYFFCYLSYLNAFNQEFALWGYYSGREGLLVIYSYYIIFLLASTVKDDKIKHLILLLITCQGIVQVIYSLLQISGLYFIFKLPIVNPGRYSSGFFFNSNFEGSYMTLLVGLWIPRYLFNDSKFNFKSYFILLFLIIGLLTCGTMSAIVALIMMFILAIVYYLVKRKNYQTKKFIFKYGLIVLTILIEFWSLTNFTNSTIDKDTVKLKNEVASVISGKMDDSFGTGRIYIWKQTFKYIPKYFWFGIGIDNYTFLGFESGTFIYDSPLENNVINKAHNEYLNIWATGGIFLIVTYLIFIMSVFINSCKYIIKDKKENNLRTSFFFAFCGYLVQAFFNVRITLIAPLFFLITGLLVSTLNDNNKRSNKKSSV